MQYKTTDDRLAVLRKPIGTWLRKVRPVGVWQSVVLTVIICAGAWYGVFRPIDGLIADTGFLLAPPATASGDHRVLLVEAPIEAFVSPSTDWELLTKRLLDLGAVRVAFTALPTLDPRKLAATLSNARVDAAASVDFDHSNPERTFLRVPPALASIDIAAVSHHGRSSLGVHRSVPGEVSVGGGETPSLEMLVAVKVGVPVPEGELLIDFFTGPPQSLPRTTLQQVQSGELIQEAVKGRVALVGPVSSRFEARVVTPLTSPRVQISELEFHAYALDTLLRGSTIRTLPRSIEVGLAALAWLCTLLTVAFLRLRGALLFATIAILVLVALEIALLPLIHAQLPVVAIVIVIGGTTLVVLQSKSRQEARDLRSLVTSTTASLANRWVPEAPSGDKAFWRHLLAMVDQLMPLSRSILLVRVEDSDALRVAGTLRCAAEDVAERRRTLTRSPYLQARDPDTPYPVTGFLSPALPDEQVLMLPLTTSERLCGYWVFSLNSSRVSLHEPLVDALRRVAFEIAEEVLEYGAKRDNPKGSVEGVGIYRDLKRLGDNLHAIDRHVRLSEQIFRGLRTPTVVFDIFGRTIAMNERMKSVLQTAGDPSLASAPYLLEVLCHMQPEDARHVIVGIIFEGHQFEHTAKAGDGRYMLRAVALTDPDVVSSSHAMQSARGLQIELLPIAEAEVLPDRVDLWDALERAVGRVASLPQFESLDFEMDGARELPLITARAQPLTEALAAIMQLLAEDATLPGTVTACVDEQGDELVLALYAKGYGVPPESLEAALCGPQSPASGPLRQIRALKDAAFSSGSFNIESELGQGYRVRIALPVAR